MTSNKPKLSPKTQEIYRSLVEVAVGLGPEVKMPTVQQLRRDFGVSVATLDNVLTELENQNVIYRRQGSGIYVSPYLHKKTVGLVCAPEFFRAGTSPFWSEIVEDMRKRASLQGEVFRFYLGLPAGRSQVPVHEDLQDDIAAKRLDGLFFIGNNHKAVEWLEAQGIAVVNFAGRARYKVEIDYQDIVNQSVEALANAGCKRIGLVSPFHYRDENPIPKPSRLAVHFENVLNQQGLEVIPSFIWDACNIENTENRTFQEQGFDAAFRLYHSDKTARPDGLVIVDDMVTRGFLVAMQKLGIHLGRDVQITSHTNRGSAVLQGFENDLIQLEIDPGAIVQAMFEMLDKLMKNEEVPISDLRLKAQIHTPVSVEAI